MKTPPPAAINAIYGSVEANANVTQIYSVNARELEASVFTSRPQTTMFSPEWLLFHEKKAPLTGRAAELAALHAFADDDEYFRWWSMHGPAGIGKSRLAHDFLEKLADTWSGGFLAPDRTTIGGATAWEPQSDTFWVIDYAAAHTEILSNFLCVLARRFAGGPYKVRVLLLEREASQTSAWWRNLMQQAGSNAAVMEETLFAPSMLLKPLAEQTGALLEALLVEAGCTADAAHAQVAAIDPAALDTVTASGRPLLVAMTAAAIMAHDGEPQAAVRLPQNVLDWYLARELRLWRDRSADRAQFDAVCHILFVCALSGGFYLIGSDDTVRFTDPDGAPVPMSADESKRRIAKHNNVRLKALEEAVGYPDMRACLAVIDQTGMARGKRWNLQPDMLGERLIQLMLAPPFDSEYAFALPQFDESRLGRAVVGAVKLDQPAHWTALARLDDDSVAAIMALLGKHGGATMRFVLITLRQVAEQRHRALPAWVAEDIFSPGNFPTKFVPGLGEATALLYELAAHDPASPRGRALVQALDQAMAGQGFKDIGVWLVPFMVTIGDIQGAALYALVDLYARHLPGYQFVRPREVMLGMRLLLNVSNRLISTFKGSDAADLLPHLPNLTDRMFDMYGTVSRGAESVRAQADAEDVKELRMWITEASAQFSYTLLSTAAALGGAAGADCHRQARAVAQYAIQWAVAGKRSGTVDILIRNALAASYALDPRAQGVLELRDNVLQALREDDRRKAFLDIVTDCSRIAANAGDAQALGGVVDIVTRHADWLGDALARFDDETGYYLSSVQRMTAAGDATGAFAFLKHCAALAFLRDGGADDELLGAAVLQVALAGAVAGPALPAEMAAWLEETMHGAGSDAVIAFCGRSLCGVLLAAHLQGHDLQIDGMAFRLTRLDPDAVQRMVGDHADMRIVAAKVQGMTLGHLLATHRKTDKPLSFLVPIMAVSVRDLTDAEHDAFANLQPLVGALVDSAWRACGSYAEFLERIGARPTP